jgi:hypothetical protein
MFPGDFYGTLPSGKNKNLQSIAYESGNAVCRSLTDELWNYSECQVPKIGFAVVSAEITNALSTGIRTGGKC